jgi:Spore coat polysaccharide biosynthesis protein, predicted glycosyltransferase
MLPTPSSTNSGRYQRVLLRADGAQSIGMGHVVRTLALARELLDVGTEVEVWGSQVERGRSFAPSFGAIPIKETTLPNGGRSEIPRIRRFNPDLVVADGYHFSPEFFRALDTYGIDYGVVDDNGETKATAPKLVVNPNPSFSQCEYLSRFPSAQLLLGLDYALIRREIREASSLQSIDEGSVFLSLGGTDVLGMTPQIIDCLQFSDIRLRLSEAVKESALKDQGPEKFGNVEFFAASDFPVA